MTSFITKDIPSTGPYIWKYRGEKSSGKGYSLRLLLLPFVVVSVIVLLAFGIVALDPIIKRTGIEQDTMTCIEFWLILAIIAIVSILGYIIVQQTNSQLLTFALDENGKLYYFNYSSEQFNQYFKTPIFRIARSSILGNCLCIFVFDNFNSAKQIRHIDDNHIIESIMNSGQIYPYGNEIIEVKSIERKFFAYRIYYTILQPDGTKQHTTIVLSKSYKHLSSLLQYMDNLKQATTLRTQWH